MKLVPYTNECVDTIIKGNYHCLLPTVKLQCLLYKKANSFYYALFPSLAELCTGASATLDLSSFKIWGGIIMYYGADIRMRSGPQRGVLMIGTPVCTKSITFLRCEKKKEKPDIFSKRFTSDA